jgi:hypothetical protein
MKDNMLVNFIVTLISDDNACSYRNGRGGVKPKRTWRAISSSSSLPRLPGRMDAEVREVRALLGDAATASPESDWGRTPPPPAFPTPPHDLFRSGGASRSRTPTPMRYSSLGAPTRASPRPLAWPGDAAIDGDPLPPPPDPRQEGGRERAATTPMCYSSLDRAPTRATALLRTRNIFPGNAGEKKEDLILLLLSSFLTMKEVGLRDDLQDDLGTYWPLLVRWMWFKGFISAPFVVK